MKTTGRFYLTPKKDADLDKDEVCYTRNPMGKNKICTIMKQIIAGTELERCGKRLTNHSGRKTIVRKLKNAKIPESSIIKVTGHTTPAGLRNYDTADEEEFKEMSDAVSMPQIVASSSKDSAISSLVYFNINQSAEKRVSEISRTDVGGYIFNNCSNITFKIENIYRSKYNQKNVIHSSPESSQ